MKASVVAVLAVTTALGCSSGPAKLKDAAIDVPVDAAWIQFTGEYVDWASTDAAFCGIANATFQVHGDASRIDHTAPNGRFILNVASDTETRVDITPPTTPSDCPQPFAGGTYQMPGLTLADPAVIATGQILSLRDFSTATQTMLEGNYGAFDPGKGHVFVHVDGNQRSVSLSVASSVQLAYNGTTWATGDTGINVFFMNATVGNAIVMMTNGTGAGSVPVEPGTITYVTLVGN